MQTGPQTAKARWWKKAEGKTLKCQLCPRECAIAEGRKGFCQVRQNIGGELFSLSYGYPVAIHVDPIEKKPLAEFMPGTRTFSIGTYGCNLNCSFCQNYQLSRGSYNEQSRSDYASPELIVELAPKHGCSSIAFTYNEPTVFAEYAFDIATLAKRAQIPTVIVSNGYITLEAARDLYPLINAANIDMKGFSEEFYRDMTGARLKPVLDAMEYFHK
ncbi:MAG: AmmeMemoRadiSam system radical SAM enzyme, partial [Lentisphaerae bacterium GWF2_52_8]